MTNTTKTISTMRDIHKSDISHHKMRSTQRQIGSLHGMYNNVTWRIDDCRKAQSEAQSATCRKHIKEMIITDYMHQAHSWLILRISVQASKHYNSLQFTSVNWSCSTFEFHDFKTWLPYRRCVFPRIDEMSHRISGFPLPHQQHLWYLPGYKPSQRLMQGKNLMSINMCVWKNIVPDRRY